MTADPAAPQGPRYSAPAAACAADLLKLLSDEPKPLSVAEMARALGASKSLVFRVTRELETRDLVRRTQQQRYRLGLMALEIGSTFDRRGGFLAPVRIALRDLAQATDSNANVAVLRGRQVLYILREERPGKARTATQIGSRLPANCTALGKALLARLDAEDLEARLGGEHERLTARSKARPDALRAEIARTRREGFAVSREEAFRGRACVALAVDLPGLAEPAAISVSADVRTFAAQLPGLIKELARARARVEGKVFRGEQATIGIHQ
jgi:DNA-binding IclR family transcriptional regulator